MNEHDEDADECLRGGGECGRIMRRIRWADSELGPPSQWPRTLRTLVPIVLSSRFAMRILWGPSLVLLYNDAYRPVLGPKKHPAAMGRPVEESYHELWDTVGPMFARVQRGETIALDDGLLPLNRVGYLEECYFTLSYSPLTDDEGAIQGVFGVVHETTERVLAERRLVALRLLATRLADAETVEGACQSAGKALEESGADVPFVLFYVIDDEREEARLVYASPGLAASKNIGPPTVSLGEDQTAWPLRAAADKHAPLAVTDVARRFGEVHAGPFPEAITSALLLPLTRSGTTRPHVVIVAGINPRHRLDDNYQIFFDLLAEHAAKAVFNVLARQRELHAADAQARIAQNAERAAEAERKRLYELFMQAPMPVAIVRGEAQIMELANDAALKTWGKTSAILGQSFSAAFPELEGKGFEELLRSVVENNAPYRGSEVLIYLARGRPELDEVYWNFVYAPLVEVDRVAGVLVCGFEVTDQIVARRGVERLANELAQQKTALESANRVKDEFVATMSHELRTPLNAILGWTRMMKMGQVAGGRVPHALETIERNAVAQVALIDDLLDVSRILTGKLRLHVESVDLPRVVEASIDTIRPAADARGIQIHAVIDSHAGPIMGDPDRLSQIISNLLSNAVKFTAKGGRIHVHLERANSMIRLSVKDNGVGIAPEFLPFVFDRFRQADQTITRSHQGLGLGLSIVKHLAELHGGSILAESEGVSKGSSFTLTIPLAPVHPRGEPHAKATPVESPAELRGLRVLVVDDELDARELLSEILAHAGVEVRAAANAEAAMREMQEFHPHILICDIGMPGEDGYSLMQRIRALPPERGGRVRAAAVTAFARGEDRRRAMAVGFNLHLSKPVDPSELIVSVARLAERYTPIPP